MDYNALKADIAVRFPKETAAGDAQAAAVGMNALTTTIIAPIPYETFQPALMQMQCWGTIRVAATKSTTPDNVLGLCLTAIDLLTIYKGRTVDTTLPSFQNAVTGLVAAQLMTAGEQAQIAALANQTMAYVPLTYGVAELTAADVLIAWGKPAVTVTQ